MAVQTAVSEPSCTALSERRPTTVLNGPPARPKAADRNVSTDQTGPGHEPDLGEMHPVGAWPRITVRAFDLLVSLVAIVLLAPLLLGLVVLVAATSPGPPLYAHTRVGHRGNRFNCLKFRSMYVDADSRLAAILEGDPDAALEWSENQKLRCDPRVTALGQFMRRTNLDELPQLMNVARGQMSIVGPRPIVENEMSRYGDALPTMLSVKPGLTGLWQVSGRSDTTYDERVRLDLAYVRTRTLLGDVDICCRTGWQMIRPAANGAY